ncbi:MAG: hypothetical protein AAF611_07240 [Bacteroidota bacterium]
MTEENIHYNIDPEFGVESRYPSDSAYATEAAALMEARLQRMKGLSKDQVIRAKLLQLKLKMEAFIAQSVNDSKDSFSSFLKTYIDIIYNKRAVFAKDIGTTPVMLSQVINKHRAPKDAFILKLMIHSERIYENVCAFPKELWYKVYFHEKLCTILSMNAQQLSSLEREVVVSEPIAKYLKRSNTSTK